MIVISHVHKYPGKIINWMIFTGIFFLLPVLTYAQELAPIKVRLPYPMFVGTPQDFDVPNLESPLGSTRPSFLAPVGTKNVALGKFVESTDNEPIVGEMELVNDGDNEAYDGSFVELGPGRQHITIDLEDTYEIYAILIWHFHKKARVYKDVIVQISDDPDFVLGVETLFNNDHDNSSGQGVGNDLHYVETHEGKLIDCRGVHGQYVRLYSNGNTSNDLNHYIEVEVHGIPVK
ncbi:MAG: hypothetical protein PVH48_10845 [Cyclobacteriaceae bacterium]